MKEYIVNEEVQNLRLDKAISILNTEVKWYYKNTGNRNKRIKYKARRYTYWDYIWG